jgi:DNA replicative helicase MCM subunit Mcm2 (Cdc46/Mcm family)
MPKYETKECKKHGNTDFVLEGRGYYRCVKCRSYQVQKRRDNLKKMAVEYKGGKCEKCGYNKCLSALDFHHLEPEHKDFGISYKGITRKWESIKNEIDKCILVCANCHREIHMGS